ncbi:MAG TPA: ATP-grasp fold amidoligase family protein [Methylomirabilota bacterium]|nr:ATP-grasp fold amidoligase family protein [Methylomirabilota bacterium]
MTRCDSGRITEPPSDFDELVDCARRLSRGWPFVRVDLYSVEGRTVFGEMSWHPGAGTNHFVPRSYDRYWGDRIELPSPQW